MKKKLIILIVAVLVIAGGILVMKNKERNLAALPQPAAVLPVVQVALVADGTLEESGHYLGVVEPVASSDLSARITGNILTINKREGDTVRQGEVLVTIDDRELLDRFAAIQSEVLANQQRLIGAQSSYTTQQSIYGRDEKLFAAGAISQEALERSKAALDAAKATVDAYQESIKGMTMNTSAARTQAGYARITAPFSGIVTRRSMEPGDLAVPGKAILTVEKTTSYKILAQLPQEELNHIRSGSKVLLSNGNQRIEAEVNRVYPALGKNMLATVEVLTPAAPFGLPSSATVGFDIVRKKVGGLLVPAQAIVKTGQGSFVYQIKEGIVEIIPVKVLGMGNGMAAISGTLPAGAQVAVGQENKLLSLSSGSKVSVAEPAKPAPGEKK